jgi:hypothetical protein
VQYVVNITGSKCKPLSLSPLPQSEESIINILNISVSSSISVTDDIVNIVPVSPTDIDVTLPDVSSVPVGKTYRIKDLAKFA